MQKRVNCFFITSSYYRIAGLRRALCVTIQPLFLAAGTGGATVPRQRIEIDIATSENDADALVSGSILRSAIAAYGTAADGSMMIFIVSQMVRMADTIASSLTVTMSST